MMKRVLAMLIALIMMFSLVACNKNDAPATDANKTEGEKTTEATDGETKDGEAKDGEATEASDFHIGVVTGTVSQSEDEQRGCEGMIAKYGDAKDGGLIVHKNYPDSFSSEQETTIQQIVSLADDPKLKVIVVNQGVPGTAAAFKQVKERRPDIFCFVSNSQEDPNLIESAADLVIDPDNVTRGYLIPLAAQKMGAKKFVHVSFPRHMSIELLSLRKDIMEATCDKIGMEFAMETAPDPTSDIGIPGAQNFILEQMPAWVQKYGKDTAFFATNDSHTEPMLLKVSELGALFVEQDLPSPILGYPGALGLDLKEAAGDFNKIVEKEEEVLSEKNPGRMGTWKYSYGFSTTQALIELGKRMVESGKDMMNTDDVKTVLGDMTPGAAWNVSTYVDRTNMEERKNHILVLQDTYVFGKGFLKMTDEEVPDIYKMLEDYQSKK